MHSDQDGRPMRPSTSMTVGRSSTPLVEIDRQLDARIDELVRRLLGEPNRSLSSRSQLRFGRNGSLAVEIAGARRGRWYDHEHKQGGGALDLVVRCTGLSRRDAAEQVAGELGLALERRTQLPRRSIVATYDYRDESGALLFQVVRYAPKTFRQRCPDGHDGWSWRIRGIRQVSYRLPELLGTALDVPVFVVEGEKDAERLARLGLIATCNAGGANTWPEALTPVFQGRMVCILPDNDAAPAAAMRRRSQPRSQASLTAFASSNYPSCRPAGTSPTGSIRAVTPRHCWHCPIRRPLGNRTRLSPPRCAWTSRAMAWFLTATKH